MGGLIKTEGWMNWAKYTEVFEENQGAFQTGAKVHLLVRMEIDNRF